MPMYLDFLSNEKNTTQDWMQCSLLGILLYKLGCYKAPIQRADLTVTQVDDKIKAFQEAFIRYEYDSGSQDDSVNQAVYREMILTSYNILSSYDRYRDMVIEVSTSASEDSPKKPVLKKP